MNWIGTPLIGGLSRGGMQISWLALSLLVLNRRAASDSLPWVAILLFYPISWGVNLFLHNRNRGRKFLLGLNGIGIFFVFGVLIGFGFLGIPAPASESWLALAARFFNPRQTEFLIFVTCGVSWGLGCRLALSKISFRSLLSEFQFGLAVLFGALFAEHHLQMNLPHLIPLCLGFFSFALLGVGITHGDEHAGWTSSPSWTTWTVFLLIAVALVLSAGLLITILVSPAFVHFLLSLLYRAGQFLFEILGRILGFLLSLLPLPESSMPIPPPPSRPAPRPEDWAPFFLISDSTREILRVLWTLMVSALLGVALWRVSSQLLDWLRRRMGAASGEEVEPLPGAFRADLRVLLLWIFDTLSLRWAFRFWARRKGKYRESDSIRQVYARLLHWAAAKGCQRDLSQTPFEYLPRLFHFLPQAGEDFAFLTRQYVRARYGLSPPAGEVFEEVKHRWENIQRTEGRKRKRGKKKIGDEAYERNEK